MWRAINHGPIELDVDPRALNDHVVIVGCGRVGRHIAEALGRLNIPRLVVEADPRGLAKLQELRVPVLYGDAGSSEILDNAALDRARALVITLPDDAAALAVAMTARQLAPTLRIISRASTWDGARRLKAGGVTDVVRPELEGGVEIVRRTLIDLELPVREVQHYVDVVRREGLGEAERPRADQARVLDQLLMAGRDMEMSWMEVAAGSALANDTIGAGKLRTRTGASIVAIASAGTVSVNPGPDTRIHAGDRIAIIGSAQQIESAATLTSATDAPAH